MDNAVVAMVMYMLDFIGTHIVVLIVLLKSDN